jgi:hypothetical protein
MSTKEEMAEDYGRLNHDSRIAREIMTAFIAGHESRNKEVEGLKAERDRYKEALEYYVSNCDACNFSGVDEAEFSARGCPACDCLQARQALEAGGDE